METNAANGQLPLSEAEHLLKGRWTGHAMSLLFEGDINGGKVSMGGINNQPAATMDYTLHYLDNELRLKIQSNSGERNYIINRLTDQVLELSDGNNNTLLLQRVQ